MSNKTEFKANAFCYYFNWLISIFSDLLIFRYDFLESFKIF